MEGFENYFNPYDDWSKFSSYFSSVEIARKSVQTLENQLAEGHGESGYILAMLTQSYGEPLDVDSPFYIAPEIDKEILVSLAQTRVYYTESFMALHKNVEEGDNQAMHLIGQYYQCALPPLKSSSYLMVCYWFTKYRAVTGYRGQL